MTFTKESGVMHVFRKILRRITLKNESNPQRPQQLRCWEKLKTLMFSLASKHRAPGLLARHCWCYSCSSAEKMKDSLTAEGGNYSNAGLSINPRSPALRNVTSHCVRIKTAGLVRLTWFKGDLKMRSGWIFIIVGWLCSHTANTHLCPNTM